MTDGKSFDTYTTLETETLNLDVDPNTHPAWNKDKTQVSLKGGQIDKFKDKYDMDF